MNQALQDFFQKVSADATLQVACSEAVASGKFDTVVRLGTEAGFSFTIDDLEQACKQQSAELSEEDLAKVAGGGSGEDTGLQLQSVIQRQQHIETTLSNIMKRVSTSQENIIANIK